MSIGCILALKKNRLQCKGTADNFLLIQTLRSRHIAR